MCMYIAVSPPESVCGLHVGAQTMVLQYCCLAVNALTEAKLAVVGLQRQAPTPMEPPYPEDKPCLAYTERPAAPQQH